MSKQIFIYAGIGLIILGIVLFGSKKATNTPQAPRKYSLSIKSIDTMKYSRDLARAKANDSAFDTEIENQIRDIAQTGAIHVAISTPYDEEFIPFMTRWVDAARRHGLHVWFRGNFSGWEGWFSYPKIDRAEHTEKVKAFIDGNSQLFQDGDIFTSCPECENGGPGDPRNTKDVKGHRNFLIQEKKIVDETFSNLDKRVETGFSSMNADVALLVMDKKTTQKLGGFVTIDHYVHSPKQLREDIIKIHNHSGGNIILGEFGAPIPDIQGAMSEDEQAQWIDDVFRNIETLSYVKGVNYWVNKGGSTMLWNDDNSPRKAVAVVTKYFTAPELKK